MVEELTINLDQRGFRSRSLTTKPSMRISKRTDHHTRTPLAAWGDCQGGFP